jgi:trans-aconitate 2-methyltransferase
MSPRDWNASSYDSVSTPQQQWGAAVLERLELRGDETVLDAGAGTGRVTEMVLQRLPHGRVIAVDGSPSMCETARRRLPADRVSVICADLLELELADRVDAIVSTATFHWIHDHAALFARLRASIRDGGQFVAQCGGHGNIDGARRIGEAVAAREPYAAHLAEMGPLWNYADAETTRARLEDAGFEVSACWLQPAPVTPPAPREFLETVIYGPYLDRLPATLRAGFIDAAQAELGDPLVLEYVRLNWDAAAKKT